MRFFNPLAVAFAVDTVISVNRVFLCFAPRPAPGNSIRHQAVNSKTPHHYDGACERKRYSLLLGCCRAAAREHGVDPGLLKRGGTQFDEKLGDVGPVSARDL
jgi:hypothetical protein